MNITDVVEVKTNPNIPRLSPGDTVRVRQKVVEGNKTRIQFFQGVVIRIHNAGVGTNFTVRRVSSGIGVERTYPVNSPMVDGVEIVRHGKVRRAKLYYLRGLSAKASRIKERKVEKSEDKSALVENEAPAVVQAPEESEVAAKVEDTQAENTAAEAVEEKTENAEETVEVKAEAAEESAAETEVPAEENSAEESGTEESKQ
jgi:large subunit ribosomal protein L19